MKADNSKAAENASYHKITKSLPGLPRAAISIQCNWGEVVFGEQQQNSPPEEQQSPWARNSAS